MTTERILVSGGAGLIGSAVVRQLLAAGHDVRIADRRPPAVDIRARCDAAVGDLRDHAVAADAVRGCERICHLAAIVGGIGNFHRQPFTLLEANNALTGRLVEAAIAEGVVRFAYVSSSMVFERADEFPTTEEYLPRCPTPKSAYGFSKLAGEYYCRAAHDEFGLPFTILRPFNAYGPGEHAEDEPGIAHAVPDLIRKTLAGQYPLELFGSGRQTRTLTYVDDIARGIVTALFHPAAENEDFNISAARELTVAEIARLVWRACGREEPFDTTHLPSFEVDVQRRWPSVEKAKRVIAFETQVDVEEGLDATVAWFREMAEAR